MAWQERHLLYRNHQRVTDTDRNYDSNDPLFLSVLVDFCVCDLGDCRRCSFITTNKHVKICERVRHELPVDLPHRRGNHRDEYHQLTSLGRWRVRGWNSIDERSCSCWECDAPGRAATYPDVVALGVPRWTTQNRFLNLQFLASRGRVSTHGQRDRFQLVRKKSHDVTKIRHFCI